MLYLINKFSSCLNYFFKPQPKCFEEKMDLIIESCYCDWMRKVAEGKDEDKKFKRKEILTKI